MLAPRPLVYLLVVLFLLPLAACAPAPLLAGVGITAAVLSPNGDSVDDSTVITYAIGRDATVSIALTGSGGRTFPFRTNEPRSAGSYEAIFDGVTPVDDGMATRRVLPDGDYTIVVTADDGRGGRDTAETKVTIRGGDPTPVLVQGLAVNKATISPNGDGDNDETVVNYGVSKDAEVVLFVQNALGETSPLDPRAEKKAGLYAHYWNGTANGRLLPDGEYQIHVQAFDKAGNVSEAVTKVTIANGGKPELTIQRVEFSPLAVPIGGVVNVTIAVKNTGKVAVKTLGPPPGTPYRTDQNFNGFVEENGTPRYFSRPGVWRVAVSFDQAGGPYPFRWGLFADDTRELQPGEEVTITGQITILARTRVQQFWASVEQSGVGFPGGEVGRKTILVDY